MGKCIATPLQMAWPFCNANGRGGGPTLGGDRGRGELGWDGNKANSKAGSEKEGVSVIAGRRLPLALPASLLLHPPFPPRCSPFPSRAKATAATRERTGPVVTVGQRGLSGSWPPEPLAAAALPGPCAPLTPRPSQTPHSRGFRGASQGKTPSKRKQTQRGGGGKANGALRAPRTSFLGASFHPPAMGPGLNTLNFNTPARAASRYQTVRSVAPRPQPPGQPLRLKACHQTTPPPAPLPEGDPRSGGNTSEPAGTDSAVVAAASSVSQPGLQPPPRSARVPAAGAL